MVEDHFREPPDAASPELPATFISYRFSHGRTRSGSKGHHQGTRYTPKVGNHGGGFHVAFSIVSR